MAERSLETENGLAKPTGNELTRSSISRPEPQAASSLLSTNHVLIQRKKQVNVSNYPEGKFDAWELDYMTDGPNGQDTAEVVAASVNLANGESNGTLPAGLTNLSYDGAMSIGNMTSSGDGVSTACVTREEPRAVAMGYTTADPGTPCLFGVDDRDEGSHCIMEGDDKYGSFGWCYTTEDAASWGSCGESCPLFGYHKVLAKKIEELDVAMKDSDSKILTKEENLSTAIGQLIGEIINSTANTTGTSGGQPPPKAKPSISKNISQVSDTAGPGAQVANGTKNGPASPVVNSTKNLTRL